MFDELEDEDLFCQCAGCFERVLTDDAFFDEVGAAWHEECEAALCTDCAGTGEGRGERSHCRTCGGGGTIHYGERRVEE